MAYKEVEGNLIELERLGNFDVIAHGCNCFCKQKSGIAKAMSEKYHTDLYPLEGDRHVGDINKLGQIEYLQHKFKHTLVVNCYTQYRYGKNHPDGDYVPVDYDAIRICFKKLNHIFKGKKLGLPKIGCGLAGGKWSIVKKLILSELADCDVTVVILKE